MQINYDLVRQQGAMLSGKPGVPSRCSLQADDLNVSVVVQKSKGRDL
jgi:hypothetical protein